MSTTATYGVTGMTCGHRITAVREEIGKLPGVSAVTIDLVPGGTSSVTLTSAAPLDDVEVRAAVDEAGYDLSGSTR